MNNLDKEKNNLCEISKYLHIILTATGVYFLIDGNRIIGAIIVVVCALVIFYVGILRYF